MIGYGTVQCPKPEGTKKRTTGEWNRRKEGMTEVEKVEGRAAQLKEFARGIRSIPRRRGHCSGHPSDYGVHDMLQCTKNEPPVVCFSR